MLKFISYTSVAMVAMLIEWLQFLLWSSLLIVSFLMIQNLEPDLATKLASEGELKAILDRNFSPRSADTDDDDPLLLRAQVRDAMEPKN
jgi:hypothetical protein